jgi:hypothetical protein
MNDNSDLEFKEQLRIAADKAVEKQLHGLAHHLRQAFYDGVSFEMARRRQEIFHGNKTPS